MSLYAYRIDGASVHVYFQRFDCSFRVVVSFSVEDLFFAMFEHGLWVVGVIGCEDGKSLAFDNSEMVVAV